MTRIVFFHGLNTYGDDDLHIGRMRFGSMNTPWENALRQHGIEVYSPENLQYHPVTDQAAMTLEHLREKGWLNERNIFLVGHSSGGLIARALASQNETLGKISGLITVGTPHFGLPAAEFAIALSDPQSRAGRVFKKLGYDLSKRTHVFERYLELKMQEFNACFPLSRKIWEGHALCEVHFREMSWPLWLGYRNFHKGVELGHSDGFVSSKSQAWGNCLGRYALDHMNNLGFFFQVSPLQRKRARAEFERLASDVARLAKSLSTRENQS